MKNKQVTLVIDEQKYVFNTIIPIGEEIDMVSRRAEMCRGFYDRMYGSKDTSEFLAAHRARVICEMDAFIHTPPNDWNGATNLSTEVIDKFWDGWTEKSGRFPPKSKPSSDTSENEEGSG